MGDLFLASAKAVSTLTAIMGAGLVYGYYPRPHGLLSQATVRTLSSLVMYILSPSLLLSIYGRSLTWELLDSTLSCCAWCCVHVAVSLAVGRLTLGLAAPPPHLAGVYRMAIVFANAASLPFLLLSTLVQRPALRGDAGAFDRAVAYCFAYLIPWWVCIYSLGFEALRPVPPAAAAAAAPADAATAAAAASAPGEAALAAPPPPPPPPTPPPTPPLSTSPQAVLARTLQQPPILATLAGVAIGLTPVKGLFWGAAPPLEGVGAVLSLLGQGSIPCANLVLAGSLFATAVELEREAREWLGEGPAPEGAGGGARLAAAAGVLLRALRRRLAEGGGGSGAVQLVDEAEAAPGGAGAAPLGAAAAVAEGEGGGGKAGGGGGAVAAFFSPRATALLVASRLLLCPAASFALFYAARAWRVPVLACTDPVLTLTVLMQAAMPSAQTLLIVASNVGNDKVGRALSLLFIVMYPLATLCLLPWLMLAMSWAGV